MSAKETAAFLAAIELFRDLDAGQLVRLTAVAVTQTYAPDEFLFAEHSARRHLYVIADGEVELIPFPRHCWHSHSSRDGRLIVGDSNNGFFRGCASTGRRYSRTWAGSPRR